MKPVRCACGREAEVSEVEFGFYAMCHGDGRFCWTGPVKDTKEEAIDAWNEVMQLIHQLRILVGGNKEEEKGPDEGEWERLKYERDRLLEEVAWWKSRKGMYKISARYFPGSGVAELTYERVDDGAKVMLTVPMTPEQGEKLVDVIGPCVYYSADKKEKEGTK